MTQVRFFFFFGIYRASWSAPRNHSEPGPTMKFSQVNNIGQKVSQVAVLCGFFFLFFFLSSSCWRIEFQLGPASLLIVLQSSRELWQELQIAFISHLDAFFQKLGGVALSRC
jgi:hypothetical protein